LKKVLLAAALAACVAGAGAAQASTIYSQDFETALNANESTSAGWGLHNGTVGNSGGYGDLQYDWYDLSLDLSNVADALLAFDYDIQIEGYHDRFNVIASTGALNPPNGALTPLSGISYYNGLGDTAYTTHIGTLAFSGTGAGRAVYDLAAFSGQLVNLRFQFETDYSVVGRGVNLDNLTVTGTRLTSAVPEPATWALMISGFGLAGTALRRERRRKGLTLA
jgi:hypothetical protein